MIGIILRRVLGVVALSAGGLLLAWFFYNQFHPTPEFRRNFHSMFQLLLPVAFLVVGWQWLHYEGAGIEETPGDFKCPELLAAVAEAKASMPHFLEQVQKNVDGAYIKFPLVTPGGITERIWGYVHSYHEEKFNVSLANVPIDPKESSQGRRDVPLDQVEDWQIMMPDGQIKGAHSVIALFRNRANNGKPLTPKMRKQRDELIDFTM